VGIPSLHAKVQLHLSTQITKLNGKNEPVGCCYGTGNRLPISLAYNVKRTNFIEVHWQYQMLKKA
jgi:hypothetical protein